MISSFRIRKNKFRKISSGPNSQRLSAFSTHTRI